MRVQSLPFFLVAVSALASSAWGQTGSLVVRVEDPAGAPLPGAVVGLDNYVGRVAPAAGTTGKDGAVEFPVLKAGGGYRIEVVFPGYARQRISSLRVPIGDALRIPVRMTAEIREEVAVRAARPVVDVERSASSTRVTDVTIRDLPLAGRFYQNLLTLAPGVVDADGDGNPNVHGARSRDFRMLVGGVGNVDPLTGEWMSNVNLDSIEELEVIPTGAGVEYGRAQGGHGQVLQKQGSNDFEGSFGFVYATSRWDGNGATDLNPRDTPRFATKQPSFFLSGPIVRDRVWFRLSHERIDRDDPLSIQRTVRVSNTRQSIHADQITWQASPRNKIQLQYQRDPKVVDPADLSQRRSPETASRRELGGPTWSLGWTAAQSPRLVVDSLVAYQDHEVNVLPSQPGIGNDCLYNYPYPKLDGAQCFYTNQNRLSGSYPVTSRDHRQRLTARAQADVYFGRLGRVSHRLKVGFATENERYFRELEQRPDLQFDVVRTFSGLVGFAAYRLPIPGSSSAKVAGSNAAIWVEDQMRLASNLTLTAGIRVDHEALSSVGWTPLDPAAEYARYLGRVRAGSIPTQAVPLSFTAYQDVDGFAASLAEALGVTPSEALSTMSSITRQSTFWPRKRQSENHELRNTNVAPRLAVSWDPWRDGKSKLSASAGRYYDKIFLAVPLIEQEPATTTLDFRARPFFFNGQAFYVAFVLDGASATIDQRTVASDLRTPYQDELALAFEREIAPETALRVSLLRRRFRDQLQDEDINHVSADFGRCLNRADADGS